MKTYIGDSVYADLNEAGQIVLTTENGFGPSNTIYLEHEVWDNLAMWVKAMKHRAEVQGQETEEK